MPLKFKLATVLLLALLLAACSSIASGNSNEDNIKHPKPAPEEESDGYMLRSDVDNINDHLDFEDSDLEKIYFAGGCFWGVEAYMQKLYGVSEVISGYANGEGEDPGYAEVMKGDKGFAETVEVTYDPERISLDTLIDRLFAVIDPTSKNKQGNDVGVQYRTGIYYTNDDNASVVKNAVDEEQQYYDDPIVTEARSLENFYKAEDKHQEYLEKNPNGYCHINLETADQFAIEPIEKDKEIVKVFSQ